MKLPAVEGLIRRRVLVNYRVDPQVVARLLPEGFRPKLHAGHAIAGICLIRLEEVRPRFLPAWTGIASENAAHRIAVLWDEDGETREGVFIPRRDTGSLPNYLAGGRLFPGVHHFSAFEVEDRDSGLAMKVSSRDGSMSLRLSARDSTTFPASSCFASLVESSAFFEPGSTGYSVTRDCCRLDGLRLEAYRWEVKPLEVLSVESSFFADASAFPPGSAVFDHALIMRDIPHAWHLMPDRQIPAAV